MLFREFDSALREMGVGDITVPKRIRKMGDAFYGRMRAYCDALDADDAAALEAALARNLFATGAPAEEFLAGMTAYVRDSHRGLAGQPVEALLTGARPAWAALPG
jgi:cytochrome b pre-mRNA-processing protein 3